MNGFQPGDRVIVIFLGVARLEQIGVVHYQHGGRVTVRFEGDTRDSWFNDYELRHYDPIELLGALA